MEYLLKNIGMKLSRHEAELLLSEFETRGGFNEKDVMHLCAKYYHNHILKGKFYKALKLLATKDDKIKVSVLAEYLMKTGTIFKMSFDQIILFCEYCLYEEKKQGKINLDDYLDIGIVVKCAFIN